MQPHLSAAVLAGAALIVVAFSVHAADTAPGEGASGLSAEAQYRLYCSGCHGDGGAGDGPLSGSLDKPPANLTMLKAGNDGVFPRERVIMAIDGREDVKLHGERAMPAWAEWFKLEAEDGLGGGAGNEAHVRSRIEKMADFLESLQQ